MTLTTETVKVQYNGDGSTISFPITFPFWDDDDLLVKLTDANGSDETWVRGAQYTITGGDGSSGTLTVITTPTDYTPALNEVLTILSDLDTVQDLSLPTGGEFPSENVETRLDQIVRLIQQSEQAIKRALKLSDSSTFNDLSVPDPEAGKLMRWNTAESALENVTFVDSGALTIPIAVVEGGTGATTAVGAQTNLGMTGFAAASNISLFMFTGI